MAKETKVNGMDQNEIRRATKARQQQLAKAKAAGGVKNVEFSIADTIQENRKAANRKAHAIKKGIDNGNFLLGLVVKQGAQKFGKRDVNKDYSGPGSEYAEAGKWKHYIGHDDVLEWIEQWQRNCYDVIAAAKRSGERFVWNNDWKVTGVLLIGKEKQQAKAA